MLAFDETPPSSYLCLIALKSHLSVHDMADPSEKDAAATEKKVADDGASFLQDSLTNEVGRDYELKCALSKWSVSSYQMIVFTRSFYFLQSTNACKKSPHISLSVLTNVHEPRAELDLDAINGSSFSLLAWDG